MTYKLLPNDEPGRPLSEVSPGFRDQVMARIQAERVHQTKRRTSLMAAGVATVIAGTMLTMVWTFSGSPAQRVTPIEVKAPATTTPAPQASTLTEPQRPPSMDTTETFPAPPPSMAAPLPGGVPAVNHDPGPYGQPTPLYPDGSGTQNGTVFRRPGIRRQAYPPKPQQQQPEKPQQ